VERVEEDSEREAAAAAATAILPHGPR